MMILSPLAAHALTFLVQSAYLLCLHVIPCELTRRGWSETYITWLTVTNGWIISII